MKRSQDHQEDCEVVKKREKSELSVKSELPDNHDEVFEEPRVFLKTKIGTDIEIEKVLGEGVYGKVFQVIDHLHKRYALKLLKLGSCKDGELNYRKEKNIMNRIGKHMNLVQLHSSGLLQTHPDDCFPFALFMNLCGPSIFDIMTDSKRQTDTDWVAFQVPDIRTIGRQIAEGMAYLDSVGVYHLDLKPENVFSSVENSVEVIDEHFIVMSDLHVKIGDFGSATTKIPKVTRDVQTQNYRAPEIMMGIPYSRKSDVWSLGCILCEMYTGILLFYGNEQSDTESVQFDQIQWVLKSEPSPEMWRKAVASRSKKVEVNVYGWYALKNMCQKLPIRPIMLMQNIRKDDNSAIPLFGLIEKILAFDPANRPSFADLKTDPFFK